MNTTGLPPQDKSLNPGVNLQTSLAPAPLEASQYIASSSSIAFIDTNVSQIDSLIAGMAPGTEVHILKSGEDAITQITETLLDRQNISSLHIISHGESGGLQLGTDKLDFSNIKSYSNELQVWGKALTTDADILLYGCNIASDSLGKSFVEIFSNLTGADVAASDDLTGATALGGDWDLEYIVGKIEGNKLDAKFAETYNGILPVFSNTSSITIPSSGSASPYPSAVNVSGFSGTVGKVTITLTGFTHTYPDDVDILLVAPNGQNVVLMSDAGGGDDCNGITLTFDDAAPATLADSSQIISGTYKPTDYTTGDVFPSPAPTSNRVTNLSGFNGLNPNGTWNLYIVDDAGGDAGSISGWSLDISSSSNTNTTSNNLIDSLAWAKRMGSLSDTGKDIVVDNLGNVYTVGFYGNTGDFDPGDNVYNLTNNNASISSTSSYGNLFISKLDRDGNFIWAKQVNINGGQPYHKIAVDNNGNLGIIGCFTGTTDFNPGSGVYNLTSVGSDDTFILKLDTNGNFLWANSLAGNGFQELASDIAFDNSGNIYATGQFQGQADFDPGVGTFYLGSSSDYIVKGFVWKLNSNGNFVWAKETARGNNSRINSLAIDSNSNVYITGCFSNTVDFDPGSGTFTLSTSSFENVDVFISKLDINGNFVWAKSAGGANRDVGNAIALDSNNNVYIAAEFRDTADLDFGSSVQNFTARAFRDAFISKLDQNGNFIWSRSLSNGSTYEASRIAVTGGNIYTTGYYENITNGGSIDVFISKLDLNARSVWFGSMGGTSTDYGEGIAVDNSGNVYITGTSRGSADFDPNPGTYNINGSGVFVTKFSLKVPTVSLMTTDSIAAETTPATNTGTYRISRNTTTGSLTVKLAIDAGSTASTSDYSLSVDAVTYSVSGSIITVNIPDGVAEANLVLTPIDDTLSEEAETLKLNLIEDATYILNNVGNTATVTINTSDQNTAPIATNDTYNLLEGGTLITAVGNITSLVMNTEPGNYVGQGRDYYFVISTGSFSGSRVYPTNPNSNNAIRISYSEFGNTSKYWDLEFAAAFNAPLTAGTTYTNATRFPFQASNVPGLNVSGEGRGYNNLNGLFSVNQILYGLGHAVTSFDASFEERGDGDTGWLRGRIKYNATANGLPAGILTNDTDAEKNRLTAILVSSPTNGSLSFNADGTFTYTPNAGFNGTDSFTYRATDGIINSNIATVTLNVAAVNKAPVNTIPGTQIINEDTNLVFSAANGNAVSISDVDAGSQAVRVTLNIAQGNLTLGRTTGLTFSNGDGSVDSSMTFTGVITDINAALNGMRFTPTNNFNGVASIQITTNDLGNTGSGGAKSDTDTISITVNSTPEWQIVAVEDFTGDGKQDIVQRDENGNYRLWRLNSNVGETVALPTISSQWQIAGVADFNRDNAKDILWHNSTTGQNRIWQMGINGASEINILGVTPGNGLKIEYVGDFDGDGDADILWKDASGFITLWEMNNTTPVRGVGLPGVSNINTKIEKIADFDGDGDLDILWRDYATGYITMWEMDGLEYVRGINLPGFVNPNLKLEAVANFDGDGDLDIIWRDYSTGRLTLWEMNGLQYNQSVGIRGMDDVNAKLEAVADFDGDGKLDILWNDTVNGWHTVWKMDGINVVQGIGLLGVGDTALKIRAVGDFDGDGKIDILFNDPTTSVTKLWFMDGTNYSSEILLPG